MRTTQGNNSEKGFTLLEVMIAGAILTVGLIALTYMQSSSAKHNAGARRMTSAAMSAESRIENIVCADYGSLDDADGDGASGLMDHNATSADQTGVVTISNMDYDLFWNVAEDFPVENTKSIVVTVHWQGAEGGEPDAVFEYVRKDPSI
jgi:prepilin-type N-terminal cleavage/methylation domain-containing protein